jgi:adenine-specific DNA-methyltransferase
MAKKKTRKKTTKKKDVVTLTHDEASRKNIPTAEFQSVMAKDDQSPIRVAYERRNRDLDPQLVWRGKDEQDWSDLVTHAPPLFIQEKVHPKVLIDDLLRRTQADEKAADPQMDLFADFNGLPDTDVKTEFYQHDANWTNRMILGDSLQVMASLAEREGLRGQVQCIYIDPPYGIKFNSNFQWSTTSRDVKDGNISHITREPEQVRAFRDTWRDGIHSYLSYLRDRLTVCRDLLHQSGSVFVQIGDENIHRVRALMDEVFGEGNFISLIGFAKTTGSTEDFLGQTTDYLLWYAKDKSHVKFRQAMRLKKAGERGGTNYNRVRDAAGFSQSLSTDVQDDPALAAGELEIYSLDNLTSQSAGRDKGEGAASWFGVHFNGRILKPSLAVRWKTNEEGMARLKIAGRLEATKSRLGYVRYLRDFPAVTINNRWDDVGASFMADKVYVVQTSQTVVQRCLLLATDPGDLVLDPTCGSGTTAVVAEHWGRRWITIDTSRVALILARSRIMAARYPYYLLADSKAGVLKEAEITRTDLSDDVTQRYFAGNIRQGFVYERIPHIQLSDIARNAELDVIWESLQPPVVDALAELNTALKGHKKPFEAPSGGRAGKSIDFAAPAGRTVKLPSGEDAPANALLEWEVPREAPDDWPESAKKALEAFWLARIARQKEIDASIAAKADFEYLHDKPYEDKKKVRVAGPFTVETLSPHRVLHVGADDELIDPLEATARAGDDADFASMILENLKAAGVQQAHKEDKITFSSIAPWPGRFIAAEGRYIEGGTEKRAGIFVGPEFGTCTHRRSVLCSINSITCPACGS